MIDQHKTLSEKFLKKGFWLYLFSFIIAPIGYVIKIIISGELSVSEVGILYGIISLITMISAYNDLGMTQSTLYFIPRYVSEKRYDKVKSILAYSLITQVVTWLSIALFFFFWADYIANNYFESSVAVWSLKIFAFFFLWINIFQILASFFMAIQNTFLSKAIEFIRILFSLFSVIIILFLDLWNLINYSYTWLVWLYLWIIFALIFYYKNYHNKYLKNEKIIWSKKLFNNIFKYSIVSFLWAQWATILSQIDMQMIIILLWTTDAWYYTNYLTLMSMAFVVLIPIFNVLPSIFSELDSKKEYIKIQNIKTFFNKFFIIVWFLLSIVFFIYNKEIAYIFFWEKFIVSWEIIRYSILFLVFNILLQINFHLLWWIWKVKERTKIIYLAIILNIITNYILIKNLWVYWAALATWIGWLFIWIISEFKIDKKYRWIVDYVFLFKNIAIFSVIWLLINNYLSFSYTSFSKIELFWIISLIWFSIFALFLTLNLKDTKQLISNIKNR